MRLARLVDAMPQHVPDELDPDVDWITTRKVAELLGVTRTRVGQLVRRCTSRP